MSSVKKMSNHAKFAGSIVRIYKELKAEGFTFEEDSICYQFTQKVIDKLIKYGYIK